MSSRLKKRKHGGGGVELNMAAMLDMAFQLLTFFILTFRPAPVEGQVMLRLPPPQPVTKVVGQAAGSNASNTNLAAGLNTLRIMALGKQDGSLGAMAIGETSLGGLPGLDRKLREILSDPASGFDQVIIEVGSGLNYEGLMQVIDVCTRQTLPTGEKLTKLSFVEVPDGTAPAN